MSGHLTFNGRRDGARVTSREVTDPTDQAEIDKTFREYRRTRDRRLRNELALAHRWIPERCARRFAGRGEPTSDLVQVGELALVRAVERFDPEVGSSFPKFAVPTVLGEMKRHFRDKTWPVSVPRRSKELVPKMNTAVERFQQRTGRSPSASDIAAEMQVEVATVLEAMEANRAYRPASTDQPQARNDDEGPTEGRLLRSDDLDLDSADVRVTVQAAVRSLDVRSRRIVLWRFYEGCTQSEIGERLGVGQVHVSRLLRRALGELKEHLADGDAEFVGAQAHDPSDHAREPVGGGTRPAA